MGALSSFFLRKNIQFSQVVQVVKTSKIGMITGVVILTYFLIAALDSLHYRPYFKTNSVGVKTYYSQPKSVLDKVLSPWDELSEKTYSEPLSNHLYTKETSINKNGVQLRIYPTLRHIPKTYINKTSLMVVGLLKAMCFVLVLLLAWSAFFIWKYQINPRQHIKSFLKGEYQTAWRSFWVTLLVITIASSISYELSQTYHLFGTDKVGDDVFYVSIKSIRTAVIIGTVTTLVLLPIAILFGICAGYFGGIIDDVIQYIYTTLNSIPGILLIATLALLITVFMAQHPDWFASALERADIRLLALCFILGVTSWTGLCRLLRAETMKVRELDYIMAAKVMGLSKFRILLKHVLPNVMYLVVISIALDFSGLILAESILSYVGVGVDPTMASWGNMINGGRLELGRSPMVWWPLISAFSLLFILILSANLFADVVRDALDPRLRK